MLLAFACLALPASAQAPTPSTPVDTVPAGRFSYRSYGAELGLANVAVLQLLQDRQGFLWVGTEDGLFRYDGYRFDGFALKEGLPSTAITSLLEDKAGTLWVGTLGGLTHLEGQRFIPLKAERGLPSISIDGLAQDGDKLFVATTKGPYSGSAKSNFSALPDWPAGEATAIVQATKSGVLWVARWTGTSHMMAWQQGAWQEIAVPEDRPNERIDALAEDGAGRLWARTASSLWLLNAEGTRFEMAATPIVLDSTRGYLATGKRGELYVPTDHGLLRRTGDKWEITMPESGLPGAPLPVLEDREGSLWIGSVGVHRLLGGATFESYTTAQGLPFDTVWNIIRDRRQRLLVGTSHGLAVADGARFRTIKGTENTTVRTIAEAADGSIYLAGVPANEVLRYVPSTGEVSHHPLDAGNLSKRIFRLLADHDGTLWVSTDGAGLWGADSSDKELHFKQALIPGGTTTERMSDIRQDSQGRIWVAGKFGLAMLEHGTWHRYTTSDGLHQNHISYVLPTRSGDLLLPYFEPIGVSRMRYENGKLTPITLYDAASSQTPDKVFLAGEDALGRIWLGGGRGIDLLTPQSVRHFGAAEGLIGEDITAMAFLAEPDGDVWFGTTKGLVHFDQKAFAALPVQQPLVTSLIKLAIGGKDYPASASGVRVAAGETFEVRFAGISFIGEGNIQYRERLLGREESFNITDTREARYSALPHGHYRFEVAARIGEHGAWGPTSVFTFDVIPAWWQTWWARLLAAIGTLLLLATGHRWRLRQIRDENQRLEAQVAARTEDLQNANAALQEWSMIDPLTGLKNRRYLSAFMPEELARTMRQQRARTHAERSVIERNIDICVLMVDLDHFKLVNDEHGHAAGDAVLQQVAEVMRSACRASDVVVRWGGEEFLIIARNIDRDQAHLLAQQVCDCVRRHTFTFGENLTLRKSCSVGYTAFPVLPGAPEQFGWEQVLELADQCLYAAKKSGRDGWVGALVQEPGTQTELALHTLPGFGPCLIRSSWPDGRDIVWH
ncbi:MAG: diguanylate cyclase [Massilia sp.]